MGHGSPKDDPFPSLSADISYRYFHFYEFGSIAQLYRRWYSNEWCVRPSSCLSVTVICYSKCHRSLVCHTLVLYQNEHSWARTRGSQTTRRIISIRLSIFPSFQLGTVTLAGRLVSVRAINRSTSTNCSLRYQIH